MSGWTMNENGTVTELAYLCLLLGYIRVNSACQSTAIEQRISHSVVALSASSNEALINQLRQTSERIGVTLAMGDSVPAWLQDYQQDLISRLSDVG